LVTTNIPACGLPSKVWFDESEDEAEDEDDNEDMFASIRDLDFLCSFISDIEDDDKDDNNDVFSLLLLSDFAYEFKSIKMGKANINERIKTRKLNTNLAVSFGKDISSFTCL
jgi:hypothetical protein